MSELNDDIITLMVPLVDDIKETLSREEFAFTAEPR